MRVFALAFLVGVGVGLVLGIPFGAWAVCVVARAIVEAAVAIIFLPHRFIALHIPACRGPYEATHAQRRRTE
jgi:uncharacterized membrane protein YoaK (UPF0700 family)